MDKTNYKACSLMLVFLVADMSRQCVYAAAPRILFAVDPKRELNVDGQTIQLEGSIPPRLVAVSESKRHLVLLVEDATTRVWSVLHVADGKMSIVASQTRELPDGSGNPDGIQEVAVNDAGLVVCALKSREQEVFCAWKPGEAMVDVCRNVGKNSPLRHHVGSDKPLAIFSGELFVMNDGRIIRLRHPNVLEVFCADKHTVQELVWKEVQSSRLVGLFGRGKIAVVLSERGAARVIANDDGSTSLEPFTEVVGAEVVNTRPANEVLNPRLAGRGRPANPALQQYAKEAAILGTKDACFDRNGNVAFRTLWGGVLCYDAATRVMRFVAKPALNKKLKVDVREFYTLALSPDGELFAQVTCTSLSRPNDPYFGLAKWDKEWQLENVTLIQPRVEGLVSTNRLACSPNGDVWIERWMMGNDWGLGRFRAGKVHSELMSGTKLGTTTIQGVLAPSRIQGELVPNQLEFFPYVQVATQGPNGRRGWAIVDLRSEKEKTPPKKAAAVQAPREKRNEEPSLPKRVESLNH